MPDAIGQVNRILAIADLLNPIDNGYYEHPERTNFNQNTYAPKAGSNGLKRERLPVGSVIGSDTESSDGYESSTKSISSDEEKRKKRYVRA